MADCPYARCIQERKHIRRELLRWTKNMVFVVGELLAVSSLFTLLHFLFYGATEVSVLFKNSNKFIFSKLTLARSLKTKMKRKLGES